MNAEIIAIGTELLLGQIANSNAQHISRSLAELGINVFFHTTVGDNLDRAAETIAAAVKRSDCVIITGGLGPTPDDVTREAIASALGLKLERDESLTEVIQGIFHALGRDMPEENLKQADLPEGARSIPPEGTAPGFVLEHDDVVLFALPGVPWEMKAMLEKMVLPELEARAGEGVILSRHVLVVGLGESLTNQKIADLVARQSNPTIAFLAGGGQVRVRITARAANEDETSELIAPVEREIRTRLGAAAVEGNQDSIVDALVQMLRSRGATMGAAESLTGGLIGVEATKAAGSSDVFKGSLVCYSNEAKERVAGVDRAILEGPGPVSDEAARALAEGAARVLGCDLGVSATGVAGPEPHDGEPVGTVFVGATYRGRTEARRIIAYGDRDNIKAMSVTSALDLARRLVQRTSE